MTRGQASGVRRPPVERHTGPWHLHAANYPERDRERPKPPVGARVRLTGEYLRNTGQSLGDEGGKLWTVVEHDCQICRTGRHVAVDEPAYHDEKRPRHLALANVENVDELDRRAREAFTALAARQAEWGEDRSPAMLAAIARVEADRAYTELVGHPPPAPPPGAPRRVYPRGPWGAVLRFIHEPRGSFLQDPSHLAWWTADKRCADAFAEDGRGAPVLVDDPAACRWCFAGALARLHPGKPREAKKLLDDVYRALPERIRRVVDAHHAEAMARTPKADRKRLEHHPLGYWWQMNPRLAAKRLELDR